MSRKTGNPISDTLLALTDSQSDDVVIVRKVFVQFTGCLEAAMMLNQIMYWTPRSTMGGWIAKSDAEFAWELSLTVYSIRKARDVLKALGLVRTKKTQFSGAPTTHYMLDIDNLSSSWQSFLRKRNNDFSKTQNRSCENAESLTETTTETNTNISPVGDFFASPDNVRNANCLQCMSSGKCALESKLMPESVCAHFSKKRHSDQSCSNCASYMSDSMKCIAYASQHHDSTMSCNEWCNAWLEIQVVRVPTGGKASDRDSYYECCVHCTEKLDQSSDMCENCGAVVTWIGSRLADKRERRRKAKAADDGAKRAKRKRYDEPVAEYLMSKVHSTGRGASIAPLKKEDVITIRVYTERESERKLKALVDDLIAEGRWGSGLKSHFMNILNSGKGLDRRKAVRQEETCPPGQSGEVWR